MNIAARWAGRRRVVAVGSAVVGPVLLWLLARLLDVDLRVDMRNGQPPMDIGLPMVIGFTLGVSLAGWAVLVLLQRRTARAATIWRALAATVLALSFVPVFSVEAAAGTRTVLAAMHLAVGVALIGGLPGPRSTRTKTEELT